MTGYENLSVTLATRLPSEWMLDRRRKFLLPLSQEASWRASPKWGRGRITFTHREDPCPPAPIPLKQPDWDKHRSDTSAQGRTHCIFPSSHEHSHLSWAWQAGYLPQDRENQLMGLPKCWDEPLAIGRCPNADLRPRIFRRWILEMRETPDSPRRRCWVSPHCTGSFVVLYQTGLEIEDIRQEGRLDLDSSGVHQERPVSYTPGFHQRSVW